MIQKTKHAATNYKTLKPFLDVVKNSDGAATFTADGYMDLNMDDLGYTDHAGNEVFAISHYGKQNGDAMADPDMEFSVDTKNGRIIPRTYQNDYLGIYQEVFKTINGKLMYSQSLIRQLDEFLWQWLKNIKIQGFTPDHVEVDDIPFC